MPEQHIITTCTRDCPNTCGLIATVRDGRLIKLSGDPRHPLTRGRACVKAARYARRVYSQGRVTTPLLRAHRTDPWQAASWRKRLTSSPPASSASRPSPGPRPSSTIRATANARP